MQANKSPVAGRIPITSEILDQLPPNNPDAERSTLGGILLVPERIEQVLAVVAPSDFYSDANQKLFTAMIATWEETGDIETLVLVDWLKTKGQLEAIGGSAYLAEVLNSVAVSIHAVRDAEIVARLSGYRTTINAAMEALRTAYEATEPVKEIVARLDRDLTGALDTGHDSGPVTMMDAGLQAMEHIEACCAADGGLGLPTGFIEFDEDNGGLHPGELCILAGRPSMGKSSLAGQIAYHSARNGRLVYFASLEMRARELTTRLACTVGHVSGRNIRRGELTENEKAALAGSLNEVSMVSMTIHDRPGMSIRDIRRNVRREREVKLVVVDYLQLLEPEDPRVPREQQVSQMARSLKKLALEFNVPVLCLAQLNRQADGMSQPSLSHLRESGAIEQDADTVMFIHRKPVDSAGYAHALWTVAKQRNGDVNAISLWWYGRETCFSTPEEDTTDWWPKS